jgi:hypothetical protein
MCVCQLLKRVGISIDARAGHLLPDLHPAIHGTLGSAAPFGINGFKSKDPFNDHHMLDHRANIHHVVRDGLRESIRPRERVGAKDAQPVLRTRRRRRAAPNGN